MRTGRAPRSLSRMNAALLGTAGTAVGLVAAISLILQARRLRRLGTACEVSIPIRLLALAGYAVWLAYGVAIGDVPLILVDLAGVAGAALVLQVTVSLRRRTACPVVRS
jgi:MtN3 and saliva related transmembrane protein